MRKNLHLKKGPEFREFTPKRRSKMLTKMLHLKKVQNFENLRVREGLKF